MTQCIIDVARVVSDREMLGPSRIGIDDGVITSISPFLGPVADVTLVPGFVDLQVNGIDDVDVSRAAGRDWDRLDDLLVAQGTTTWLPTLISSPLSLYTERFREISRAMDRPGLRPTLAGIHLEGPFLGTLPGAHVHKWIIDPDLSWVAELPKIVRMMTVGVESDLTPALIVALCQRNVLVSVGHTNATVAQTVVAFDAGARMVTHGYNAMSGLHHREPGVVGATLAHSVAAMSLIADGVHVSSQALRIAAMCLGSDRMVLVTDAVAWRSPGVGDVQFIFDGVAPRLRNGTLAGSALTMDAAVRFMHQHVGVGLVDVVRAASTTPAHLLGLEDRGLIALGKRADLVALDSSFGVASTWIAGKEVFPAAIHQAN